MGGWIGQGPGRPSQEQAALSGALCLGWAGLWLRMQGLGEKTIPDNTEEAIGE